jgi:hypothetical protein
MGKRVNKDRVCSVQGCNRIHRARGYCGLHWQRWKNGVDLNLPPKFVSIFKHGWIMNGYRWLSTSNGEQLEHRYKMELQLGRKLHVDEVVHHKNGDKLDNRIQNLEVMTRAKHTSHHRAHRFPCLVCGVDDMHGSYGLCAVHQARARSFVTRFNVTLPLSIVAKAVLLMGIAQALETDGIIQRLESLYAVSREA